MALQVEITVDVHEALCRGYASEHDAVLTIEDGELAALSAEERALVAEVIRYRAGARAKVDLVLPEPTLAGLLEAARASREEQARWAREAAEQREREIAEARQRVLAAADDPTALLRSAYGGSLAADTPARVVSLPDEVRDDPALAGILAAAEDAAAQHNRRVDSSQHVPPDRSRPLPGVNEDAPSQSTVRLRTTRPAAFLAPRRPTLRSWLQASRTA